MSLDRYETTGLIECGRLKVRHQLHFERAMRAMPDGPVLVTIQPASATRSAAMNRLYWRWYVQPLSDATGNTPQWIHAYLKKRFLAPNHIIISDAAGVVVDETDLEPTTRTLTTHEFSTFLDHVAEFAETLNVPVGPPVEDAYAR
jgi:hypothetical protein